MSVEIHKYDLKRKPGMQKLFLTIYQGYSISKDGKKKLHQSQKSLDLEISSNPVRDNVIERNPFKDVRSLKGEDVFINKVTPSKIKQ